MITICCTYFRSLSLAHLSAALYSVLQQDFEYVAELIILDNNTANSAREIGEVIDNLQFPVPVRLLSYKHGDLTKTHSWSTNAVMRAVTTPWVFFTRGDYLLRFDMLRKCFDVVQNHHDEWDGFVTGNGYHLHVGIEQCEEIDAWRHWGPGVLKALGGVEFDYTVIDSGVWLARTAAFDRVGGFEEQLTAWGHAQTHFQYKLFKSGTEFVRIPEVLFYHPFHGGPRDIELAHQQLQAQGVDLKEMWARYEGVKPY